MACISFINAIKVKIVVLNLELVTAVFGIGGSTLLVIIFLCLQVYDNYISRNKIIIPIINKINTSESERYIKQLKQLLASADEIKKKNLVNISEKTQQQSTEKNYALNEIQQVLFGSQKRHSEEKYSLNQVKVGENELNKLSKIQGIRIEHVTLLRELGIQNCSQLSYMEVEKLYRIILNRRRPHEKNMDWIPSRGMIKRWIRIANQVS